MSQELSVFKAQHNALKYNIQTLGCNYFWVLIMVFISRLDKELFPF